MTSPFRLLKRFFIIFLIKKLSHVIMWQTVSNVVLRLACISYGKIGTPIKHIMHIAIAHMKNARTDS